MKTKILQWQRIKITILLLCLVISTIGFAQNPTYIEKDFTIRVKLKIGQVIDSLPNFTEDTTPYDNAENSYYQAYFNAQNPELLLFYVLSGQGNQDSMVTYLTSTNLFDVVKASGSAQVNGCVNPLPVVNDSLIGYHLDLIDANCAWSITTGDTNIVIGIADTEFDSGHDDLDGQVNYIGGPHSIYGEHGTGVAGCAAAKTNNAKGIAAIGHNCRLALQRIPHYIGPFGIDSDDADKSIAIWTLYQQGVPIINVSWATTGLDYLVAQEMTDNGTTLVLSAGNSPNSVQHVGITNIPGVIQVSGVNQNNEHGPTGHAHNQYVDLCAPSKNISVIRAGVQPTPGPMQQPPFGPSRYNTGGGTSYAAPIVSGTIGLMLSVNPCLSPASVEAILKSTTDPIADAASYPGIIGTGKLNAYEAVKAAQAVASTNLDLSIKDNVEDYGVSGGYPANLERANSPDIWVRNQPDGFTNQKHQNPEFTVNQPVYIYVRVRNESCFNTTGSEQVSLYWTKASPWSSWPQNWDGTNPTTGNLIGSQNFMTISGGEERILQFTWNILNPYVHENWATCLLARIENSTQDPITVYPARLDLDVYYNNNIAQKNLAIVDFVDPPISNYPHGKYMYIGNPTDNDQEYSFKFTVPKDLVGQPITEAAEVKIIFDQDGWDLLEDKIESSADVEIVEGNAIVVLNESFWIENVTFPANTRIPIYVGFSFLTDEVGEKTEFKYQIEQYLIPNDVTMPQALLGEEHFIVKQPNRSDFDADAGSDQSIKKNELVTVSATDINETATYNWYDEAGNLVYSGKDLAITPQMTEKYKLEVIAGADGFKDYDEVIVEVKDCYINSISPNPANNNVVVDYKTENTTSAYIMVLNATATTNNNYIINVSQTQANFNVTNYQQGTYSVILVCDGIAVDMKTLIVQ